MDTYKQICAKLVEAWDSTADGEYEDFGRAASYLVDWTRDALAEPEPDGPTDIEIASILKAYAVIEPQMGASRILHERHFGNAARAILARLGNHQGMLASSMPQPIPVSERLPEMDDCDADGRCWVGYLVTEEMEDEDLNPSWELCQINPDDEYWLPANALPVPS